MTLGHQTFPLNVLNVVRDAQNACSDSCQLRIGNNTEMTYSNTPPTQGLCYPVALLSKLPYRTTEEVRRGPQNIYQTTLSVPKLWKAYLRAAAYEEDSGNTATR